MNQIPERRRSSATDEPPLRLLVVDDDCDYRGWVVSMTRRLGFIVDSAPSGDVAIQKLAMMDFDIAVVDLEMPRLNGIDVIRRLRAGSTTKDLYSVMLTGRNDLETKLAALDAGFDDYVIKAATEAEIVSKLIVARRIATRQRSRDVAARELYGLATRDELTGVFNRRFFAKEAERLVAECEAVSVILFDLDDFKAVNDTYGHLAGDRILRDVGALFGRSTRSADLIARYGGDEFVMVIAHLGIEEVEVIAARLARDIGVLQWSAGGEPFGIGASFGVASSTLLAEPTLEVLLNAADRDLYKNKWLRKHPDTAPEPDAGAQKEQRIDLVMPMPSPINELAADANLPNTPPAPRIQRKAVRA